MAKSRQGGWDSQIIRCSARKETERFPARRVNPERASGENGGGRTQFRRQGIAMAFGAALPIWGRHRARQEKKTVQEILEMAADQAEGVGGRKSLRGSSLRGGSDETVKRERERGRKGGCGASGGETPGARSRNNQKNEGISDSEAKPHILPYKGEKEKEKNDGREGEAEGRGTAKKITHGGNTGRARRHECPSQVQKNTQEGRNGGGRIF